MEKKMLKKDQKQAKLRLNKETLMRLEDSQLWLVAGGYSNSVCSNTGIRCCQLN